MNLEVSKENITLSICQRGYRDRNMKVTGGLVRVFSDVLVAFLYFDSCHLRQSNSHYDTPEFSSPFKDLTIFTKIVKQKLI